MTSKKYLTVEDFRANKVAMPFQVRTVREETIDGWPSLVVYFVGEKHGLVLDKQLADQFLAVLGPNPQVEEFFKAERTRH